jgi:hypothetical protein
MTEGRTTATVAGLALTLVAVTWAMTPRVIPPAAVAERGEALFPQFRDPNAAASLEIMQFDSRTATVVPFKVQNRKGRWTIPSQHDYPADAGDRLAQTSAAIIALKKENLHSDNAADFERCGVIDPLDPAEPSLTGRGTHVVVRGIQDEVLADVIFGNPVAGHPGLRYVRLPNQKRIYVSEVGDLKITTAFGDWIERDLLQVTPDEIDTVNLRNYALDRTTGVVSPGETLLLQEGKNGGWTLNGLGDHEQLNMPAVIGLMNSLATLKIAGVLPKPAGITSVLRQEVSGRAAVGAEDRADLARKGFYLTSRGQLVSNRGEIVVRTKRGVFYTLRFGDLAPGDETPPADTSGPPVNGKSRTMRENRYLFIMVDFDPSAAITPGRADEGAQRVQLLRARFAPWYYVISADRFEALRVQRSAVVTRDDLAHH